MSPRLTSAEARRVLEGQVASGRVLLARANTNPIAEGEYEAWRLALRNRLEQAFGEGHANVNSVMAVDVSGVFVSGFQYTESYWQRERVKVLEQQLPMLEALISVLAIDAGSTDTDSALESVKSSKERKNRPVFLVHGHDEGAKQAVARFLEKLVKTEIIVLHERPDKGRSVIEKYEDEAVKPGFAVVLMTADDRGGPAGGVQLKRARQNVIFELGYFLAKLGRSNVRVLLADTEIERPSDFDAPIYEPFSLNNSEWKMGLARELSEAGYEIDSKALLVR